MDFNIEIKKTGLKKSWLAEQLGINRVSLSHYINGTRTMPEGVERKLKEILRTHLTQFNNERRLD